MLKKTILRLVALIVVLSLTALALAGCVFIQKNEERIATKEIITVYNKENGIKLSITQNEILDYYNSYAYYLSNYYQYTAKQVMDFAVESKIKNKYLITVAMSYLIDEEKVPSERIASLYGEGKMIKPVDVLTLAEYYASVATINKTIQDTVDSYTKDSYQTALNRSVSKLEKTNVVRIEFSESTLSYLKDEYYVNQSIDTDKIKFVIVYEDDDGKEYYSDDEYIVPASMYSAEFNSAEASTDLSLTIKFEEKVYADDGTVSYESHEATHTYDVVTPRATKTEKEDTDDDIIKIGDVEVNRYDSLQTLNSKLGTLPTPINVSQKYDQLRSDSKADTNDIDAYRQMKESLSRNYKTSEYLYEQSFESAVVSALQVEVQKTVLRSDDDTWDSEILSQFKYQYNSAKQAFPSGIDKDLAFATSIKSGLANYYYHPETENLEDYFFVYQILINFSDEQKEFLNKAGSDEYKEKIFSYLKQFTKTKESNTNYDADFDCEKHEKGDEDADCKYLEEDETHNENDCPSLAYKIDDEGNFILRDFEDIYKELSDALIAIAGNDMSGLSNEEKQLEAFKLFEDYMYKYNDDGGIMNSANGYLIVPGDKDPNGFYESFVKLAKDVYAANNNVGNAFVKDENGDFSLGYAYTDYGIHIIMTSQKPFTNGNELVFTTDAERLDFIKNTQINLLGDTIYSTLKEKVIADAKTLVYSEFTNELVPSDILENNEIVTKNQKAIDNIYSTYIAG